MGWHRPVGRSKSDQRYLSGVRYDTLVRPVVERREAAVQAALANFLTQTSGSGDDPEAASNQGERIAENRRVTHEDKGTSDGRQCNPKVAKCARKQKAREEFGSRRHFELKL